MKKENIFIVVSPARDNHPALDRAIINAKIRKEGEESRLILYVTIDPEEHKTTANNPKIYCDGNWFKEITQRFEEENIEYEVIVSWSGEWGEAILKKAEEYNADLLMGSLYDDWDKNASIFSNDYWNILRSISIPVLMCRPSSSPERQVVLAAVKEQDEKYSELCSKVYERANWAASRYGAELHMVNAYEDSMHFPDRGRTLRRYDQVANEHLHIKQGDPSDVVCDVASEIEADIIVLGTKRRKGLKAMMKGNTIEKLIKKCGYDIMMQVE